MAWDEHRDYAFSGYIDPDNYPDTSPDSADRVAGERVGWDVSHARRFVEGFGSLYALNETLSLEFPNADFMRALASKFAYQVFNGDFDRPLFSNFMDGSDGWYRVDYSNRDGFGYGPGDKSAMALQGGYGRWMELNSDLVSVFTAAYDMMTSTDAATRQHVIDRYEHNFWKDYARYRVFDFSDADDTSAIQVKMSFYSSICY